MVSTRERMVKHDMKGKYLEFLERCKCVKCRYKDECFDPRMQSKHGTGEQVNRMNRTRFSSDEVADIVFKIVGEIEPVGETNTDNARFSNLQTLLNTLDILIDEVTFVLPCENRYEYSMQRAGQEVRHWIKDKRQQFAYNLGEG